MKKPELILDMDDVLINIFKPMRKSLNEFMNQEVTESEFSDYNVTLTYPGLTLDQFYDVLLTKSVLERGVPVQGAVEATRLLSKEFTLSVVTARGWHPEGKKITENQLSDHGFCIDRLIVTQPGQSKSSAVSHLSNRFVAIVDDHVGNIHDAKQSGLFDHHVLIDMPWNKSYETQENTSRHASVLTWCQSLYEKRIQKHIHPPISVLSV